MWPDQRLCDLLEIGHPIVQAPMTGSTTPKLAAAVTNAGGLGSIGCAEMTPEAFRTVIREVRAATNGPVNVNFFAHAVPSRDQRKATQAREMLAQFYDELGLGSVPAPGSIISRFDTAMFAAVLEMRPRVISFHFGLPEQSFIAALKASGSKILCTATTPAEARDLVARGVDAVIAQGWEAGGHHGFYLTGQGAQMGTMTLVPQVADAVDVPVIAAGGIADGRGIAAALALGAAGVQIGTAFLTCDEANVTEMRRTAMLAAEGSDTRVSRAWTGRPARGLTNRYAAEMARHEPTLPDFPLMDGLTLPLEQAGLAAGSVDFAAFLAGQAVSLNRQMPAEALVETLIAETRAAMSRLDGWSAQPLANPRKTG